MPKLRMWAHDLWTVSIVKLRSRKIEREIVKILGQSHSRGMYCHREPEG